LEDEDEEHHQQRERLRSGDDPGDLAPGIPTNVPRPRDIERQDGDRQEEHRPLADVALERDDDAFEDRDPQSKPQPPLAEPATGAGGMRFDHAHAVKRTTLESPATRARGSATASVPRPRARGARTARTPPGLLRSRLRGTLRGRGARRQAVT